MNSYLIAVIFFSLTLNLTVYFCVREATFFYKRGATDSEKNLIATLSSQVFEYISKVHEIKFARAQCREIHFFFAKLLNKFLFKNIVEEKVHIFLHLFSNFISSIFLFLFLAKFFQNPEISFFVTVIFIFSVWPYQISIYWGHIIFSTMWFLISIYLTSLIDISTNISTQIILTIFISSTCAVCYFSSSASRKYPPLIFIFFLISLFKVNILNIDQLYIFNNLLYIILFGFILFFFSKKINLILLNTILYFSNQSLKNSLKKQKNFNLILKITKYFLFIIICYLFIFIYSKNLILALVLISIFVLFFLLFILFIFYPNFLENMHRHLVMLDVGVWANHFNVYPKNFFKGYELNEHFRGGEGYKWLPKFFFRICPFVFVVFLITLIYYLFHLNIYSGLIALYFLISILALLISEISGMIRVAKAYYPVFFGFLFSFAGFLKLLSLKYNLFDLDSKLSLILTFFLCMHICFELFKLFSDVIPSRMFQVRLKDFLLKNNIKKFSTYKTSFLNATITPMLDKYNIFDVDYVSRIEDSKSNYFICPPLTSKSLSLETDKSAITNGDLTQDVQIKELIRDKKLDIKSQKIFKTFASSKIFILESEVLSFRDLCYGDVKNYDRWIGLCRVFKLKKGKII